MACCSLSLEPSVSASFACLGQRHIKVKKIALSSGLPSFPRLSRTVSSLRQSSAAAAASRALGHPLDSSFLPRSEALVGAWEGIGTTLPRVVLIHRRHLTQPPCASLLPLESSILALDWSAYSLQSSLLASYLLTAVGIATAYVAGLRQNGNASEQAALPAALNWSEAAGFVNPVQHDSEMNEGEKASSPTWNEASSLEMVFGPSAPAASSASSAEWTSGSTAGREDPWQEDRPAAKQTPSLAGLRELSSDEEPLEGSPLLSLAGLAEGPRRRLLAAAASQLRSEIAGLPADSKGLAPPAWAALCSLRLAALVGPLLTSWLAAELAQQEQGPPPPPHATHEARGARNAGEELSTASSQSWMGYTNTNADASVSVSFRQESPGDEVPQSGSDRQANPSTGAAGFSGAIASARGWGPIEAVGSGRGGGEAQGQGDGKRGGDGTGAASSVGRSRLVGCDNWGLHTELVHFMRFNEMRRGSRFRLDSFARSAPSILEDMAVRVAEEVTERYLDQMMAGDEAGPTLVRPQLASTRALERFRNEVALRRWLHRNFSAVVAMYEDRHDLWAIQWRPRATGPSAAPEGADRNRVPQDLNPSQEGNLRLPSPSAQEEEAGDSWLWGREHWTHAAGLRDDPGRHGVERRGPGKVPVGSTWGRSSQADALSGQGGRKPRRGLSGRRVWPGLEVPRGGPGVHLWLGGMLGFLGRPRGREKQTRQWSNPTRQDLKMSIVRQSMPARRSAELRSLRGWRLAYSLYLEFSDIVGPLLRTLLEKLGEAASFLLVALIGRSLGLIYKGIRQSFRTRRR